MELITTTPNLRGVITRSLKFFQNQLKVPIAFETMSTEQRSEKADGEPQKGFQILLYITVETGVGGRSHLIQLQTAIRNEPHPEIGHMKIQPHPNDPFPGNCPYHTTCLEGSQMLHHSQRAGMLIRKRFLMTIQPDFEAFYLVRQFTT